jgi:hypothetical protein
MHWVETYYQSGQQILCDRERVTSKIYRYVLQNPKWHKEAKNLPELATLAQIEDILVMPIKLIVRVFQSIEILAHTSLANDIEGGTRAPTSDLNSAWSMDSGICGRLLWVLARSTL